MVTLGEILKPRHVDLELAATNAASALDQLAVLLQGDPRIVHWAGFHELLQRRAGAGLTVLNGGAALSHARTDAVVAMVMAAGRFAFAGPDEMPGDEASRSFRYFFIIGLPPTMASEYLRVVGALARSLGDPATMDALDAAVSSDEFVTILSRRELAV